MSSVGNDLSQALAFKTERINQQVSDLLSVAANIGSKIQNQVNDERFITSSKLHHFLNLKLSQLQFFLSSIRTKIEFKKWCCVCCSSAAPRFVEKISVAVCWYHIRLAHNRNVFLLVLIEFPFILMTQQMFHCRWNRLCYADLETHCDRQIWQVNAIWGE